MSGTVLGARDDSENKIDGLCPEGVCCLAAETFIQKVFIEHLPLSQVYSSVAQNRQSQVEIDHYQL